MKRRTLNRRISQATGLVGVGMLTLTGCVGLDDEAPAEEGQDDSDQNDGDEGGLEQEQADQEGIGDDADAEGRGSDELEEGLGDEDDDLAAGEAPALEDIEDEIWDSSLDQESVTLHVVQEQPEEDVGDRDGDGPLGQSPRADDEDDAEEDDPDEDDAAQTQYELVYTGDLTGEGSSVEYDYDEFDGVAHQGQILSFEDSAFQSADSFISDLLLSAPEDVELPEQDEIEGAIDRDWIDHTDFEIQMHHTAEQYLEELRDNTEMLLLEDSLADLDAEVSEGTHDGEDVWIYESDDVELIVLADEEEPVLLVMDVDVQGIESTIEFTEWNESEGPEEPEEEEIYSAEEAMEIVEEL